MSKLVKIEMNEDSEAQSGSFMNGTLQSAPHHLAFTIQSFLEIPEVIAAQGQEQTAEYINHILTKAAEAAPGLTFDVQIGPDLENPPERKLGKRNTPG